MFGQWVNLEWSTEKLNTMGPVKTLFWVWPGEETAWLAPLTGSEAGLCGLLSFFFFSFEALLSLRSVFWGPCKARVPKQYSSW